MKIEPSEMSGKQLRDHINAILRTYIDHNCFPQYYETAKKELWYTKPYQAITALDKKETQYGNTMTPEGNSSIVLKLLLKIRGENYMEQVKSTDDYLQEVQDRSLALLKEKEARKSLIEAAKENGSWALLTLEEVQLDMDHIYLDMVRKYGTEEALDDKLKVAKFIQSCIKDKVLMQQFLMEFDLKKKAQRIAEQKKGDTRSWIPAGEQTYDKREQQNSNNPTKTKHEEESKEIRLD